MCQRVALVVLCVSVCLFVTTFSAISSSLHYTTIAISFTWYASDFYKHDFLVKKLNSQVMASLLTAMLWCVMRIPDTRG